MNLILDIGNTRVKAALFKHYDLIQLSVYPDLESFIKDIDLISKANKCIIASVVDGIEKELNALKSKISFVFYSYDISIPLKNKYSTPETLGADRILASVGAFKLYPNKDVLVIDAGTCIKYNFTNRYNEFIGGSISPVIEMRFKALNHFTSKLPMIEQTEWDFPLIGKNTTQSISSGVINGIVSEINGIMEEYKLQFPDLICLLTGGDSEFLAKQLKNSIFARPNLVLEGLNYILIHQLDTN